MDTIETTDKINVKVTLEVDPETTGNFINELESLLEKYAVPSHKYRLAFDNMPEPAETNLNLVNYDENGDPYSLHPESWFSYVLKFLKKFKKK